MIVKKNQASLYEYLDLLFRLPAHPADQEERIHQWSSYTTPCLACNRRLTAPFLCSEAAVRSAKSVGRSFGLSTNDTAHFIGSPSLSVAPILGTAY
jgi:hypothetical protein